MFYILSKELHVKNLNFHLKHHTVACSTLYQGLALKQVTDDNRNDEGKLNAAEKWFDHTADNPADDVVQEHECKDTKQPCPSLLNDVLHV